MNEEKLYQIALTMIQGLGDKSAKNLIAYSSGVKNVFNHTEKSITEIEGFNKKLAKQIISQLDESLLKAEQELEFCQNKNIQPIFYTDKEYPRRLLECSDSPILIYTLANTDFNKGKFLSIIGTRNASDYGKHLCNKLVKDLAVNHNDITIISGLAYGIDVCAHKAAIEYGLPTLGVMATGIDQIYPANHKQIAVKMLKNGGLITEFCRNTNSLPHNFVKRNRIVAGMADAVIVIESAAKGGALITADIANSYNRDVMAFPSRVDDTYSVGCNKLIKNHKAALIENASDLEKQMNWKKNNKKKIIEKPLFINLSEQEQIVFDIIKDNSNIHIDNISYKSNIAIYKLTPILISLEFMSLIKCLPGNTYRIIIND